ncbi:MAG TPA: IS1595 family transposase [Candidatus Angelobacter sp.]|nr:IS1595 family transposase [Candidatus Angelobacter sp.]
MKTDEKELKTLQEAMVYFSDPDRCREYFVARRWPEGVSCPNCGSVNVKFQPKHNRWQCSSHHKQRQFTCKTGTIFEESPITLDKWMLAMWMICNCKNGVSSYEIHRAIGVTQKSAWFMLHRIRLAMQKGSLLKLSGLGGEVEVDETFIGGKARNMHKSVYDRRQIKQGNRDDKAIVFGVLERGKEIRTVVVPNRDRQTVQPLIAEHVNVGSFLFTDDMASYRDIPKDFIHEIVDHSQRYVDGRVHTNGLENFWSLLKRNLHGTYVSVEPFHLFRYLDEQCFRFNNRGNKEQPIHDGQRFDMLLSQVAGKRILYKELTGKSDVVPQQPF